MFPNVTENPESSGTSPQAPQERRRVGLPAGFRVFSFFLSALLFLSGVLTFLAPWPLLFLFLQGGRWRGWGALIANALLVLALKSAGGHLQGGLPWLVFYVGFTVSVVFPATEMIRARRSLEATGAAIFLFMALTLGLALVGVARSHGVSPAQEIHDQVQHLTQVVSDRMANEKVIPASDRELWLQDLPEQLPSSVAILMILVIWTNLIPVLRLNPAGARDRMGLRPDFIQNWRAPEFLVWPTILCGFFLVFEVPAVTPVAIAVLNVLLCLYGLQGLSILSFFFRRWKVMAAFRIFGFFMAVFMFLPLLLALGFFDLWFDFRKKFRQS